MKKKHIRFLSILLTVVMLIGMLPISALAEGTGVETESNVRTYTVRHIRQQLDGTYDPSDETLCEVETLRGDIGETTDAAAKSYEGFTAESEIDNQTIGLTGDIVVTIHYTRNPYYITWVDGYSDTNYVSRYLYREEISYPSDPYIEGHQFIRWYDSTDAEKTDLKQTVTTMPAKDITAIAKYDPNITANIKVEYFVQNVTDDVDAAEKTYSLAEAISTAEAEVGLVWTDLEDNYNTYSLNSVPFPYNAEKTEEANAGAKVEVDNSTVFRVYFDRPLITIEMEYWQGGAKANAVSIGSASGLYGASTENVTWPTYTHEDGEDEAWDGNYYWMLVDTSGRISFTGEPPATFSRSIAYLHSVDGETGHYVIKMASYASYAKYYATSSGGNPDPKTQYVHLEGLEDNTWPEDLTYSSQLGNYSSGIAVTEDGQEGFTTAAGEWGEFSGDIDQADIDFTYYWDLYAPSKITLTWRDPEGLPVYEGSSSTFIDHDAHFYCTRNSYTITYQNASGLEDATLKYQASLSSAEPATPTAPSYMDPESVFDGWYYDTDYTQPVDWANDTMPAKNITVIAKWKLPEKTVTLKNGDETLGTIPVTKYDTIYKILDSDYTLTAEGKTFHGWYKDAQLKTAFVYTEQITEDITLYAGWSVSEDTVYHYQVQYLDDKGQALRAADTGENAKDKVLYFSAPSIVGYAVKPELATQNLTLSQDDQVVTFIYTVLDTITITPKSITAYVGGTSINGSHMPKLRYAVETPDGVELSDLKFTLSTVTTTTDENGTETETVKSVPLDPVTINETDENLKTYCLFPQLTASMNSGANDTSKFKEEDTAVQRGDYIKLVDDDNNPDTYAGVYKIEARDGKTSDWDSWYITATDGNNVYLVDLQTEDATVTILQVSDKDGMYETDNVTENKYLTTVETSVSTAVKAEDASGFLAVTSKNTTFETNSQEDLGVLVYETDDNGKVDTETITTENTTAADIALLVDDLVTMGTDYTDSEESTAVEDLTNDMIDLAKKQDADEDSALNLTVPFATDNYEFKYLDLVNASDGNAVVETTGDQTVTIYWPYPSGISAENASEYNFQILHYVGMDRSYTVDTNNMDPLTDAKNEAIQVESLEVTATENGLKFQTSSFSPFVLLWAKKCTLTVEYVCTNENDTSAPKGKTMTFYEGQTVTLENITHDDWGEHTYLGWYSDSGMKNPIRVETITMDGNKIIYGGYMESGGSTGEAGGGTTPDTPTDPATDTTPDTTPDPATGTTTPTTTYYTLIYVQNNGSDNLKETYESGTAVTLDKLPTREGYTFLGWYADEALTKKAETVTMNQDTTVYAGWQASTVPEMLNGDSHFAYIVGYEDGTVRPGGNITRAEVATIFFRLLKDDIRDGNLTSENPFEDVPENAWYCKAVSTLTALGIIEGRSETIFAPNAPITRAELATVCARFDTGVTSGTSTFTDIAGHWAEAEIQRAAALGWIEGYDEDGTFRPDRNITRAEAITMINRVLCRIPKDESDLIQEEMNLWPDNMNTDAWYYLAVQEATNSHDFQHKGEIHETWTQMQEDPDWEQYEIYD